ncbi:MAG: hypothetical protein ACI9FB_003711 [Candidatus Azotimanducaceae bacterium]|jgi:hypothetical protein
MKSMHGWANYLSVFALILLIGACDSSNNGQSDPIPSVQGIPPPPKITMTVVPSLGLMSGTAIEGGTGQIQPTADRNAKLARETAPALADNTNAKDNTLTKSMIAAWKTDENINRFEQKQLFDTI